MTAVKGSAYGYLLNVTFFNSTNARGPAPIVGLAANASNSPQSASSPSALVKVEPATFFSSGELSVRTSGSLGPNGTASASTSISKVNASGTEVFTAMTLESSCTANRAGTSGFTTMAGGVLQTDSGDDVNMDGDHTDSGEHPPVSIAIAANPAIGTQHAGTFTSITAWKTSLTGSTSTS